ncbi:uncharacterized protein LOC142334556 [Convolutriloba macropyga]|uniref:uncharacterized protein LOC142334556 n=1 Tax=Convolutriloba macropyga TaxID=536237 RepID=UPI003F522606
MGSPGSNTESVTSIDSRTSSSVASFNPDESDPAPLASSQKRKRKRGFDSADSVVSNGPQLNGNLKRLKLEPSSSLSSVSRIRTIESCSLDNGNSGRKDVEVQDIGPLIPPTRHSLESFPTEVSVLPMQKIETASSQKRKRKRGFDSADSVVSNGPQLNDNLKRLKLEPSSSLSSVSRIRTIESCSLDNGNSGRKDVEVQDIGPLIPPTRHSLESFPTEVSVLPMQKIETGSSGGSNEQSGADAAVANVKILLKCPSGERRTINVTESCTLHSFMAGCGSLGFSDVLYEFTTHFPRRVLNTLDRKLTLAELGMKSNCVVFVESKI